MGTQQGFMDAIMAGITVEALWGALTIVAPLIILVTLFSFGFGMFRRYQKKASKGRG